VRTFFIGLSLLVPCIMMAQSATHYIVDIDQEKVFVDLGKKDGVQPGAKYKVFQQIEKKHPVTGALLQDKIEIGVLTIVEVGDSLSVGRIEVKGSFAPSIGAIIERMDAPTVSPNPTPSTGNPTPASTGNSSEPMGQHFPLQLIDSFEPVEIDVNFSVPVSRVLLLYRRTGEGKNTIVTMEPTASGRYVAEIPPETVDVPAIEYQIAFLDASGVERTMPGGGVPYRVTVNRREFSEELDLQYLRGRPSDVTLSFDSVGFGSNRGGYSGATIEYHHRVFSRIYGIRMGAGFLRGTFLDENGQEGVNNLVFGLAETEIRLQRFVSFLPRISLGVEQAGFSTGLQAQLRIGREVGYNLVLGSSGFLGLGGEIVNVNFNAPVGKIVTLGGEIRVSNLFSQQTPALILGFTPRLRINDSFGILGRVGLSAQDSNNPGFAGSLSTTYFF
jgi:hypothetical protein